MPRRRQLLAFLLLVAVSSAPELVWLGAHALDGHGHPGDAFPDTAAGAALAKALVHGHDHPEGTPPHEHDLAPAPRLRQDLPRQLQSAASSSPLALPPAARVALSPAAFGGRAPGAASGCSPPRLQLLCSLLI